MQTQCQHGNLPRGHNFSIVVDHEDTISAYALTTRTSRVHIVVDYGDTVIVKFWRPLTDFKRTIKENRFLSAFTLKSNILKS